jgi:hypothetical protein
MMLIKMVIVQAEQLEVFGLQIHTYIHHRSNKSNATKPGG